MALDEKTRHALHTRFEEILGPEHAAAAMTAYPPAGEELATRRDISDLHTDIDASMARLEAVFHREIHQAITGQTRLIVFSLIGTMLTTFGMTLAAIRLG